MTYLDYFRKLQKDFAEKSDTYLNKEMKIAETSGFGDMNASFDYFKAKTAWQISSKNYFDFITFMRDNNIDPNNELSNI